MIKRTLFIVFGAIIVCGWLTALTALAEESSVGKVINLKEGYTLTIDALHRTKDATLLFKFTVENKTNEQQPVKIFGWGDLESIKFLDLGGRKRYGCIEVASNCLGSRHQSSETIPPGAKRSLWGHFTAPPAEVKEVAILISDLPPVTGIFIDPVPAN